MKSTFSVLTYDKDNDVYSLVKHYKALPSALKKAKKLSGLVEKGELRNSLKEPVDWIEIYEGWDTPDEKRIWVSGVGFTSDKYKEV